ncbi:glucosamine inositolphosphorylceramide transferase family protein [Ruegeria marina]|uniref:Glucosamine inositolphosphorylceramide transferase 1 N-terminal domain-containing protein n=1 Tax=Ruegeria marina TaxID=639004 RepID=A0A1G6IB08_9RHOB|nr:hypothetical protein [Ruegeria marina]SDC03722.1 hypothetical protein SAMN04488239_10175 [Ruegeria marina]
MSDPLHPPLRIVLVVDALHDLTDAEALLIDRLSADPKVVICGRIAGTAGQRADPLPISLRGFLGLERFVVGRRILPYDTRKAVRLMAGLPEVAPDAGSGAFDLALVLGAKRLAAEQLALARFGEWMLSYGGAADPGWIWTVPDLRAKPRVEVEITQRHSASPAPVTIRRTSYNPKPGAVLTGAFVAEKSVLFLHHALSELADRRAVPQGSGTPLIAPAPPALGDVLSYAGAFARTSFRKFSERIRERQNRARQFWRVAHGTGSVTAINPMEAADLPDRRQIMADPFLFEHQGELWVFYEAMSGGGGNGWIEAARLLPGGTGPSVTALTRPYHLSFPFVFSEGSDIFMIPETQQSRRLEVWRATDFPTEWVLHATAFEGQYLAESSLFRDDHGQWWLLTNLSDHYAFQDHSSELYLFAVDGPDLNSISPHPKNPVVFGADLARNAGAIIRHRGRLYRPSQNNSFGVYGYGLNLMEVLRLDGEGYEERLAWQLTPKDKPGSLALHHLSVVGDQYVFDWCGE